MDFGSFFGSATEDDGTNGGVIQDITSYLRDNASVIGDLVKVGQAAFGNQTAAQIAAGQPGAPPPIAPPASASNPAAMAALQKAEGSGLFKNKNFLGLSTTTAVLLGVGAYFAFFRKGK